MSSQINVQGQASSISIEGLQTALAKAERASRRQMSAEERRADDVAKLEAAFWEKHPNAKAPVKGSWRVATEADLALFASQGRKCHGTVCTIVCEDCGGEWLINAQDAFQVHRCADCQAKVNKGKARKGATKMDRAALEAEVARLKAEIATRMGDVLTEGTEVTAEQAAEMTDEQVGELVVDEDAALDVLTAA